MVWPDGGAEQVQGGAGERAAVLEPAADELGDRQTWSCHPRVRFQSSLTSWSSKIM